MYNINSLKKSRFPRPSFKYYIVQLYTRGLNTLENCAMTNLHSLFWNQFVHSILVSGNAVSDKTVSLILQVNYLAQIFIHSFILLMRTSIFHSLVQKQMKLAGTQIKSITRKVRPVQTSWYLIKSITRKVRPVQTSWYPNPEYYKKSKTCPN